MEVIRNSPVFDLAAITVSDHLTSLHQSLLVNGWHPFVEDDNGQPIKLMIGEANGLRNE